MLIEVKAKVKMLKDDKSHNETKVFLIDKQFFAEAEYAITEELNEWVASKIAESYEIQSLRISPIKEVATQYKGDEAYIATLKDIFTDDNGKEKPLRYRVYLEAYNLDEAYDRVRELASQGYDMTIEGLKEMPNMAYHGLKVSD